MIKKIAFVAVSFVSGILGAYVFYSLHSPAVLVQDFTKKTKTESNFESINYKGSVINNSDFVKASSSSTPSVVFIKTLSNQQNYVDPQFDFFSQFDFFGQRGPVASSGSGVIVSENGYIVTNYHVIKGANTIEVILNNKKQSYQAKLVGSDPSTDIAVLKIEAKQLPHIVFGNSDDVQIGEWVLAVGNPFNLTSTVTAGIVSAKGRNINIVNNQFPIESFIQTDAAINPGNSGGALVDLEGRLVGINTAISSQTGSYIGYGFAIPSNIVSKIIKDLIDFKEVQRGYTGMEISDIDSRLAQKLSISNNLGVYVSSVLAESPADKAGIRTGDVIVKINGKEIDSKAIFDELMAYMRPGDKAKFTFLRNGKETEATFGLINKEGNTAILRKGTITSESLGADFQSLPKLEKDKLGIKNGIKIYNIKRGKINNIGLSEGFILIALNKKQYEKPEDLITDFEQLKGQVVMEGIMPNGGRMVFSTYVY
jgi:Do/DeqQ family serine protease